MAKYHPLDDGIKPVVAALAKLIDYPVKNLPAEVQSQSICPSYRLASAIGKRVETLRAWLQVNGRPDAATEIHNRYLAIWHRLQEWEISARLDHPPQGKLFAQEVCDQYESIIDTACNLHDYLRTLGEVMPLATPVGERNAIPETFRPTPQQERIISILRDSDERMTTTRILEQLDAHGSSASIGVVKQLLAELVRNNVLDNRQDVVPKGYGIRT